MILRFLSGSISLTTNKNGRGGRQMATDVERGLAGTRRRSPLAILLGSAAAVAAGAALAQAQPSSAGPDALAAGFRDPPNSARPRVWWHWMNGNVTKDGITADLEWMQRVGIAGMQMFDGSLGGPL